MVQHYIRFFVRNMLRKKGFTIINILGLSVGMAVSILILLYVFHEISYDKYIENRQFKYKVFSDFTVGGEVHKADRTCGELAKKSMEDIPEVVSAVSLYDDFPYLRYGEKLFQENHGNFFFTTPGVFDYFQIQFVNGNKETVFKEPFSIVMSETMAKKYFEDEEPIGKTISYNDKFNFKVTGVMKDFPDNSHLDIAFLIPMEALLEIEGVPNMTMLGNSCVTYVELIENADLNEVSQKLEEASYSFFPPGIVEQLEFSLAHNLQEVSRIHLFGSLSDFDDTETLRRIVYVYIFAAIAVFILLLACINFMNLSTARYAKRMKEVGMRKILGANRSVLIKQFMGESVFYTLISLLTAVVLAELFLPTFNNLLEVKLNLIDFENPVFLLMLLGLGIIVGIISGSYPAFFLSSFKPLSVMQGKLRSATSGKIFRWGLVVFQFIIAIALISSTIVIYSQMKYIKNKDLGF